MEEYDLRHIFEQIINIFFSFNDALPQKAEETYTVEYLWKWTKFDSVNEHLNNSLGIHKYSGVPVTGRKELLNDEKVKGGFLSFDYIGHLPEYDIKQYNSFEELINAVISGAGILNPFVTLQIPIIHGIAKDILFVLKYKDEASFENKLEKETIEKITDEIIKICK